MGERQGQGEWAKEQVQGSRQIGEGFRFQGSGFRGYVRRFGAFFVSGLDQVQWVMGCDFLEVLVLGQ